MRGIRPKEQPAENSTGRSGECSQLSVIAGPVLANISVNRYHHTAISAVCVRARACSAFALLQLIQS